MSCNQNLQTGQQAQASILIGLFVDFYMLNSKEVLKPVILIDVLVLFLDISS